MAAPAQRRELTGPPPETVMWCKQAGLSRLPVPDLGQTCMRYLRSVRPLLSEAEYKETAAAVLAFAVGGEGEELQRRLLARRAEKHHSSWLLEWWNQYAYLTDRGPVVFFVSYFYSFKRLTAIHASPPLRISGRLQCTVAAAMVEAALIFKSRIDDGSLEPDKAGGAPQCMSAYPFLFNSCRIPGAQSDTVAVHDVAPCCTQIIAARRGRFYAIATHLPNGQRVPQRHIAAALLAVVHAADAAGDAPVAIGSLTGIWPLLACLRSSVMHATVSVRLGVVP
jgi:carnitine O-acetyltransferase